MPGIVRSIRTTSGWSAATWLTASDPDAASPTTRRSSAVPSTARRPLRNESWSSAMRIRVSARGSSPAVMRGGPRAPAGPRGRDRRTRGRPRNGLPGAGPSRGVAVRRPASRRHPRLRRRSSRPAHRPARASTRGRRPGPRRTAALVRRRRSRDGACPRRSRRTSHGRSSRRRVAPHSSPLQRRSGMPRPRPRRSMPGVAAGRLRP